MLRLLIVCIVPCLPDWGVKIESREGGRKITVRANICAAERRGDGPAVELVCSLTASPSLYMNVEMAGANRARFGLLKATCNQDVQLHLVAKQTQPTSEEQLEIAENGGGRTLYPALYRFLNSYSEAVPFLVVNSMTSGCALLSSPHAYLEPIVPVCYLTRHPPSKTSISLIRRIP
jgi:hypothetical protein